MRALEWIIFKVPYNSQQSHRKGEAQGIIWNKQNWHLPTDVFRVKKEEPPSKNICSGRTQTHKLSGREAEEDTEALQTARPGLQSQLCCQPSIREHVSLSEPLFTSLWNGDAKSTLCYPG